MTGFRVIILGCGGSAGVPQIGGADGHGDWGRCDPNEPRNRRTRSSILIEHHVDDKPHRILVDTSPDIRSQLLHAGIATIDGVIYTHPHADHIAGFDELRIINRLTRRPLDLYATQDTIAQLQERFEYAFKPWQPPHFYHTVTKIHPFAFTDTLRLGNIDWQLFEQDHGFISSLGLRIGDFAYSTDVVDLDARALDILHGVKVWVVDCFQRNPLKTHANPEKLREWIEIIKPERVILTHMGYDMDWAWVHENLGPDMEPAYDGMVLDFTFAGIRGLPHGH